MRSLPPIYIPTCSTEDINADDNSTADDCCPSPASPTREDCWQEQEETPIRKVNNQHIDPSEKVSFSLPSCPRTFYFEDITFESTVEFTKKSLELKIGVPSDAFQLVPVHEGGNCQINEATHSNSRLLDLMEYGPTSSVNVRIEICQILQRTFRLTLDGNGDELISSGTLDLLDTPFLKNLPCEDVINVVLQRAFLVMYLAANLGYFGIVDIILKKNIDPNTCTPFGRTSLHVAAFHGRTDVLELLLSYGADVSHQDNDGMTAQEISASRGYTNCIRRLWLHRWNLRPPLVTFCRQQKDRISRAGSPAYLDICGRTTPSKGSTRTGNSSVTLGNSLVTRAREVVNLWSMECPGRQSRVQSPLGKHPALQRTPWRSKTPQKSNPDKLLRVGHGDPRCQDTTRGTSDRSQRSPTVSICTVVNLNSPFLAAEISPLSTDESMTPTDDEKSQSTYAMKRERKRNSDINRQTLMRKLANFRRPVVAVDRNGSKSPPDFQTWLSKKNTVAKEEAIVEHEMNEKTTQHSNQRKEMSDRAYRNWLSSKRRHVKPKVSISI